MRSAASLSSLGPIPTAVRTRSTSNWSRVAVSMNPGTLARALLITSTCSALINPWAWAAAVAGNSGGSAGPVTAGRGANTAASVSRRWASRVEIRHRTDSTSFHDLAPICCGVASTCRRANNR
ncbi:hypothetical protein ACNUDN_01885 [Mycobacterium sp. smrl_JER01]